MTKKRKAKHRVKHRTVWGTVDGKKYYTPHTLGRARIAKDKRGTPYRDAVSRFYHKVRGLRTVTKKRRK